MKRSDSDSLRQALARSQQAELHPDSDLLTAFVEDRLLVRERRDLLEHLAACAACREVLSISASASATPAEEVKPYLLPRPKHPPLRGWLPWVAAAAGVVVVSSAVLIRQERKPVLTPPAQVATVDQKEVERLPEPTLPAVAPTMKFKSAKTAPSSVERPAAVPPSAASTMVASRDQVIVADSSEQVSAGQPAAVAPSAAALGKVSQRHNAFGAISTPAVRPHWRINESGQVERSFGEGVWQPVLTDERSKMRVVSVFGSDVWVGGEQSRLFHSADNGTTWNSVNLPGKDGFIHVITHIRFETPRSGTVVAEDGSSWTTGDAGRTWN